MQRRANSCPQASIRRRSRTCVATRPPARAALFVACALALSACAAVEPGADMHAQADKPTAAASGAAPAPIAEGSFDKEILYKLLVAEFAGRNGEVDLALRNYLDVARATGDATVAERAVRIAVFARNEPMGLESSALWRELDPDSNEARQVYAALLLRAGKLDEAVTELRDLVQRVDDESGIGFNTVADLLARERDKQTAVQAMEAVIAGNESNPNALFAFAHLLARAEQYERALSVLDSVVELRPADARAVMFQARVMQQQGQTAEALKRLDAFLQTNPDDDGVRTTYARLLVDAKRYDDAREQFERLAADDEDNGEVRYALGLLLLQTNRIEDAQVAFEALLDDRERRDAAHFYLGQIAETQKDAEKAIGHYRRVFDGEHHFNAQLRVAVLIAMEGEVDEARGYLHAMTPANNQEAIRITRAEAELLARHDRLEDALAVYDAAVERNPTSSDLLYARALLAERLNLIDVVERDLKAIIAREPNNADALNALGYTLADRTERYEDALVYIERALALKPDDHYVIDSMGWVLYRLGRLQEAAEHLRRAMEISGDGEVAAHLGEVLWVMGDKQGARQIWETALRTTPDDERILKVLKRFGEPTP